MTLKELSQLYYLKREIEADQVRLDQLKREREQEEEKLAQMRANADGVGGMKLDGMPHAVGGVHSGVESAVIRISEQEERIRAKRAAILHLESMISQRQTLTFMECARLEDYIATIPDSMTRQIFRARFIDGLTWEDVASVTGRNTVDSVKKACYRYIRAHEADS